MLQIPACKNPDTQRNVPVPARGFSLLELSLVIVLVGLLAGIGVGVSATMVDAGRKRATEQVLRTLDQTLTNYIDQAGANPPALMRIDAGLLDQEVISVVGNNNDAYYPAVDGVTDLVIPGTDPVRHYPINTIGLFLASIGDRVDVESQMSNIDDRFIKRYGVDGDLQPELLTVFDGWGNPIRYVHPAFDGVVEPTRRVLGEVGDFVDVFDTANLGYFSEDSLPDLNFIVFDQEGVQVRRNRILDADQLEALTAQSPDYPLEADSDGGICKTSRPYFYSAGPDGDPSTTEDNVYITRPDFINPF